MVAWELLNYCLSRKEEHETQKLHMTQVLCIYVYCIYTAGCL